VIDMTKVFGLKEGFVLGVVLGVIVFMISFSVWDFVCCVLMGTLTGLLMDVFGILLGGIAMFLDKPKGV
jgi:hypothetical protein